MATQPSTNKSSGAKTMAELMATAKPSQFVSIQRGDTVQGTIKSLNPAEILVNIGAKSEAVVLEKDKRLLRTLLSTLRVGDTVSVTVLNPESDLGYPMVSLRKFIEDKVWSTLEQAQKDKKQVDIVVREITKGGYLVETPQGLSGFLPNSQSTIPSTDENASELSGKKLEVYILEGNRTSHKLIFSQKPIIGVKEFEESVKNLKIGQKVTATIATVTPFGLFVPVKSGENTYVDGLIHISEVSWEEVTNMHDLFKIGQEVEAQIIGFDKDAKRVDLSIKRLTQDPFDEIVEDIQLEQQLSGTVEEVTGNGIVVSLDIFEDAPVKGEGFIRKDKIAAGTSYEKGQAITGTVTQIDKKRHRIILVPVLLRKSVGYR